MLVNGKTFDCLGNDIAKNTVSKIELKKNQAIGGKKMNTNNFGRQEDSKPDLTHDHALHIENIVCKVFACDGRTRSETLAYCGNTESHPFWVMISTLTYLDGCGKICRETLKKFYNDFLFFADFSISDLLRFSSNSGRINGVLTEIKYKNGEDAMNAMEDAFDKICSHL